MKTITDKQYKEYADLKRWAKKQKVWESAEKIQYLEDDVDAPIKKCVAMLALLGLEPLFSCCGFDYRGQPYHKSHQYGEAYIMVKDNDTSQRWLPAGSNGILGNGWKIRKHIKGTLVIVLKVPGNPHWRKKDCIHFSEEIVIGIANLEKMLMNLHGTFASGWVLEDTNQNYKKNGVNHWQYPPKKPWVILKELVDTY